MILKCSSKDSGTPTGASGSFRSAGTCVLRLLNAPLDLANVVQIIVELGAVRRGQILLQRRRPGPITESSRLRLCCFQRDAVGVGAAVAEQFFEHHLRIVFHRQRRGRRLPGNGVGVGAGVTRAAAQAPLLRSRVRGTAAAYPGRSAARRSDRWWFRRGSNPSPDARRSGRRRPSGRDRRRRRSPRRRQPDGPRLVTMS